MADNATYISEYEGYFFDSKYNFKKFKPKLEKHFKKGGGNQHGVIASVCGVTRTTVTKWLDRANKKNFKEEFARLIDTLESDAMKAIDDLHLEAAKGKVKDSKSLATRYENTVQRRDRVRVSRETVAAMKKNDTAKTLTCLRKDLTRNKITLAQFEQLTKSLVHGQDVDVKALQADVDALKNAKQ